jgi:hypothetical protein
MYSSAFPPHHAKHCFVHTRTEYNMKTCSMAKNKVYLDIPHSIRTKNTESRSAYFFQYFY